MRELRATKDLARRPPVATRTERSTELTFLALACLGVALIGAGHAMLVAGAVVAMAVAVVAGTAFARNPLGVVLAAWTLVVFESAVASLFGRGMPLYELVKQADEPVVVVLAIITALRAPRRRPPGRAFVVVPAVGFALAGLASNALSLTAVMPALVGGWAGLKFWVLLYVTIHLPWDRGDAERSWRIMSTVAAVVLALGVIDYLAPSTFRSILPVTAVGAEERFGSTGVQSVFTHPGHFGSFAAIFAAAATARFTATGRRRDLVLAIVAGVLAVLSLRLKVLLGLAGALAALAAAAPAQTIRRVGIGILGVLVFLSIGGGFVTELARNQIDRYLLSGDETVRGLIYETSGEIARDRFPFGVGLGQFGSGASSTYHSTVYDDYGISYRKGLSDEDPGLRHDTTWPTVLGESGVLGLAFFLGGLVVIWVRLLKQCWFSVDEELKASSLVGVVVLLDVLIESSGRPSFFNGVTAFTVALFLAHPLVEGSRQRLVSSPLVERRPVQAVADPTDV